jgi:outer membrane protein TolC/preprotein translocase subunit SecF
MVGLKGIPLTTIWEDDYPVEVRLTQEHDAKASIKNLEDQYITSPLNFSSVPLRAIAELKPQWNEGTITHRNGNRTLTISVDNNRNVMASNIFNEITPLIDNLNLPAGTSINYGGDFEGQKEVFTPMTIALLLSIVLIFFILLFQFKKVKLSLLIMSAMLLTIPGAAIGLKLMNYPFSITAFIGITSLCGMVVRNGIILIDYARELHEKMHVREAALAAGKRRMRPIFLTAAAASVGVIPMILSRSPLWGPLGTVICFGLLVSMVLTLYILPILYASVYSDKSKKQSFWAVPEKTIFLLVLLSLPMVENLKAQTLSLDSCKQLAIQNNRKIKESRFEVAAAEQQKKEAFTHYFPKISAVGMAMRSPDYLIEGTTPAMNLPVYDGNMANLANPTQFAYVPSLSIAALDYLNMVSIMALQPVYAGGQIRYGNKMATEAISIRQQQQAMTETEVLVRTEELYWNTVALSEKRKTVVSYQSMLDSLAKDVKAGTDAGLVHRSDLLKVQLKQTNLRNNLHKIDNGIFLSKLALCQHIGIPESDSVTIQIEGIFPQLYLATTEIKSGEVSNRHEFQMLSKAVEINRIEKKIAQGEHLPQLAVGATAYHLDVMDDTSTKGLVFATISIPISDWWGGSHKVKVKQIKLESAQNKLSETAELLTLQMQQTKNQLGESFREVEFAIEAEAQAREHLKVISDNHSAGLASTADLLEAKAMHQQTLEQLTDARCHQQIAQSRYKQAIGEYR